MKRKSTFLILLSMFIGLSVFAQIPTNGLITYYPFNGNANDNSGHGNNGTIYGATLTTDRFGNANSAYSFNGLNNYISIPSSELIKLRTSPDCGTSVYLYNLVDIYSFCETI